MKLTLLNTFGKRILFSIALSILIQLILSFIAGRIEISLIAILLFAVIVFIPLTLFYAIISTFFSSKKESDDNDILDRQ